MAPRPALRRSMPGCRMHTAKHPPL